MFVACPYRVPVKTKGVQFVYVRFIFATLQLYLLLKSFNKTTGELVCDFEAVAENKKGKNKIDVDDAPIFKKEKRGLIKKVDLESLNLESPNYFDNG